MILTVKPIGKEMEYENLFKLFIILLVMLAPFVLTLVVTLGFYLIFAMVFAIALALPAASVFWAVLFFPLTIMVARHYFVLAIKREKLLIAHVGKTSALWSTLEQDGVPLSGQPVKFVVKYLIWAGEDLTGPVLEAMLNALGWAPAWAGVASQGVTHLGSYFWSELVLLADQVISERLSFWFVTSLILLLVYRVARAGMALFVKLLFFAWLFASFLWVLPIGTLSTGLWAVVRLFVTLQRTPWFGANSFTDWAYWRVTDLAVRLALSIGAVDHNVRAHHSLALNGGSRKAIAVFRQYTLYVVRAISALGLPEFMRSGFSFGHSPEGLSRSKSLMQELGWPVNVDVQAPDLDSVHRESFKEWLVCGTDFATGIHTLKARIDHSLDDLRIVGLTYKRSEQYQSVENELDSTSRYFDETVYSYPVLDVNDVWPIVGAIFRRSKLTPFNYIISKWEKKYALGFWMKDPTRNKKHRRIDFIRSIGYSRFKALWADTFYWAGLMAPVAHVSVKGEPLPERKWAQNKVRSIIGSSISQYILSTIWNYGPNHRFAWDTTPIKIGMPLNGYWMSQIWERHGRFQHHCEGDFTAFDSTVQGPVMDLISAIRKKGYEFHADRARIAELIDINYEQVLHQSLGFTSTGNIFRKGTGASTGHSSTSMDNSLALIILYIMAWKKLTGKSGREFLVYNELSCYGDDHFLSFPSVRPMGWNPRNIMRIMKSWGVTNNLVVKPLYDMSFLSKMCRRSGIADNELLAKLGLPRRRFIVWHDKTKLVGKLTAPAKSINPTYRLKRLLSYLDLTAHHQDLYDGIVQIIQTSGTFRKLLKTQRLKVPSYDAIVRRWYSPSEPPPLEFLDDDDVAVNDGSLLTYGDVGPLDQLLTALSMVPDLLNPGVFNFGFVRSIQLRLAPFLNWVVDLMAMSNPVSSVATLRYYMSSGPYRFLDADLLGPAEISHSNRSSLLVRHWLFCLYESWRPTTKSVNRLTLLVRKVAQVQFILNARVYSELSSLDLSFDRLFILALLSFLSVPDWIGPLASVKLPDLSVLAELLWNRVLVWIWSAVPPNYREVETLLVSLKSGDKPLLVQAPTATGKSTALIASLPVMLGGNYRKIVIIEPRTLLVAGLVSYMKSDYGISVTGGTQGLEFDSSATFWYVTPQFMFSHMHLLESSDFLVFDEAHLSEPAYMVMRKLAYRLHYRHILLTATPSVENIDSSGFTIEIPIAKIWEVVALEQPLPDGDLRTSFSRSVVAYIRGLPRTMRHLIIVDTPEEVDKVAEMLPWPAQSLSSKHSVDIATDVNLYVATSVVDVGVTIPGLDYVHSPSWEWTGGSRVSLDASTRRQRKGRVGRTKNGTYIEWVSNSQFPARPLFADISPADWSSMMLGGLSPAFALALDRTRAATALGLDSDAIEESQWAGVMRGASVFLNNFRSNLQAHAAIAGLSTKIGDATVLNHTGIGNMESFTDIGAIHTDVLNATIATLRKGLKMPVPDDLNESVERLNSMSGVPVPVRQLHEALSANLQEGRAAMAKPALALKGFMNRIAPVDKQEEIYEIQKIFDILKDL